MRKGGNFVVVVVVVVTTVVCMAGAKANCPRALPGTTSWTLDVPLLFGGRTADDFVARHVVVEAPAIEAWLSKATGTSW